MTRNPPVRFCHKHGCLLIRRVFVIHRSEGTSYAAVRVTEKEVAPRCIYESDGCARAR